MKMSCRTSLFRLSPFYKCDIISKIKTTIEKNFFSIKKIKARIIYSHAHAGEDYKKFPSVQKEKTHEKIGRRY